MARAASRGQGISLHPRKLYTSLGRGETRGAACPITVTIGRYSLRHGNKGTGLSASLVYGAGAGREEGGGQGPQKDMATRNGTGARSRPHWVSYRPIKTMNRGGDRE
eukprot:893249-Heterocapsa_arctica.AAC.1